MDRRKVTIILGAGASKAYKRWPYPLLDKLFSEIFEYAIKLPAEGMRQRHYLAYALRTTYALPGPNLENGIISKEVIQKEFERIKTIYSYKNNLLTVFEELEKLNNETATKAYWALTYAISIYMWQMDKEDIDQSFIGYIDRAHKRLIKLIDKILSHGIIVNVIDFNYDCVLERVRSSLGTHRFGWDCGRERKVIALKDCEKIVIIGWSASGTDKFYQDIFHNVFKGNLRNTSLYVINWSPDGVQNSQLQENLRTLFDNKVTLRDIQMCGFNEKAVEKLDRIKIWGEDDWSCL